ncbi:SNARE domain- containing protein [Aspergillus undulatus]|uniref:SNARE domain- containing protein n=1 Tax=Aspergillus undulatus TaxID=1810928 RepID=UPI003CCD9BF0
MAYEREQYVQHSLSIFFFSLCSDIGISYAHESFESTLTFLLLNPNRQNDNLLNSLSGKVSALKSVTIDIYDNARDQDTLDHSVRPSPLPYIPTSYHPLTVLTMLVMGRIESSLLLPLNKPHRQRKPTYADGEAG